MSKFEDHNHLHDFRKFMKGLNLIIEYIESRPSLTDEDGQVMNYALEVLVRKLAYENL
ncbi:hypothetical protein [Vibrio anguillarum]|uniref:hypothetical protein n=1 Tax=Vibrio anguillarum TaxID=55601 RepID=UPI0013EA9A4B|nr:hypothetical protein [Vibrio anguillarum]